MSDFKERQHWVEADKHFTRQPYDAEAEDAHAAQRIERDRAEKVEAAKTPWIETLTMSAPKDTEAWTESPDAFPPDKDHLPRRYIIDFGMTYPTTQVLNDVFTKMAEAVITGQYGNSILIYCAWSWDTRFVLKCIAEARELPTLLAATPDTIGDAVPIGPASSLEEEDCLSILANECYGVGTAKDVAKHLYQYSYYDVRRTLNELVKDRILFHFDKWGPIEDAFVDPRNDWTAGMVPMTLSNT